MMRCHATATTNSVCARGRVARFHRHRRYAMGVLCVAGLLAAMPVRAVLFTDANWTGMSGMPGANGPVYATLTDTNGTLYVGGQFTVIGDVLASNIAKWTGNGWAPLGAGVNDAVYALAFDSAGNLCAGGTFSTAGGNPAARVARWNGSAWSAVGAGVGDYEVFALAAGSGGVLYAGGSFSQAGGTNVVRVAKWDGSAWSGLGAGVDGIVRALAVDGAGTLYAGGEFWTAGVTSALRVAKWNGTTWSALGSGVNGVVYALLWDGAGQLYAGGNFTASGDLAVPLLGVARWNGSAWQGIGESYMGAYDPVYALARDPTTGAIYAGGDFLIGSDVGAFDVAKWDGTAWSSLGYGCLSDVRAVAVGAGGRVFTGGLFTGVRNSSSGAGIRANSVATWDGSSWAAMGKGMNGVALGLLWDGAGSLYMGGVFTQIGDLSANRIARWNGSTWSALGDGVGGTVGTMVMGPSNTLYVGGNFASAGVLSAKNVAKWDGSAWSPLGQGLNGFVGALVFDDAGNLYVGGLFNWAINQATTKYIAKWDGSAWSAVGGGMDDTVLALARDGAGMLYAGGSFITAGTTPAYYVAKWNGSAWSALGAGVDYYVTSLVTDSSGNLYAGGAFTKAGGVEANRVAKWNGSAWSALGSGMDGTVQKLLIDPAGNLFAAGAFTLAGGVPANRVAMWNGSTWSPLGSGVNAAANALALDPAKTNLFVAGEFTTAGSEVAVYLARYWLNSDTTTSTTSSTSTTSTSSTSSTSTVTSTSTTSSTSSTAPKPAVGPGVDNEDLAWTVGGHAGWYTEDWGWKDIARSGAIGDGQQSWMQTTVTGPTSVGFEWTLYAETNDTLSFLIDDVLQFRQGGVQNSVWAGYDLPAGTHTLRWVYAKDASGTGSFDQALVDNVRVGLFGAAKPLGGDWYWSQWFGFFATAPGQWIYHNEHGWLYPFGQNPASVVFYDSGMGTFWWTGNMTYTYMYRFSDNVWLWYLPGSAYPRWFVNLRTGQWEQR